MSSILLFGSRGFLGEHFKTTFPNIIAGDADIADPAAVAELLDRVKPDVVINAAGKTGRPNVDWCEDHKEETVRSNVTGPLVLLEECGKRGIHHVHLSSGCIYEGDNAKGGFSEDDEPNFHGSFYARSKIWAEAVLREFPVLILRLRMPFDGSTHPRSLIMKLANYNRVLDEPNSITSLPDFMETAKSLIGQRATGIFNVVNPGVISPYEIMGLYREIVDPGCDFERLTVAELPGVVKAGRSNCVLSTAKLEREGIVLPDVRDAVRKALQALKSG